MMGVTRVLSFLLVLMSASCIYGRVGFEKLTELDYRGTTYYTIRNLSLYECQGWCREEPDCAAASFSFVVNPLAPVQETVCLLQNDTTASNPTSPPQKAVSSYYMVKLNIRSENICARPWTFERVPNKMLSGLDNALVFTATKESCLAACLNERRFVCRSAEYNYITTKCHLSEHDRRSVDEFVELVDAQGVDYFENLCLKSNEACRSQRTYDVPQLGVAEDRVAQHVDVHFYVDKELLVSSEDACQRACQVENEFLCRSYLYKDSDSSLEYNCQLFHLDHFTLPDGPSTFLTTDRPLLDDGEPTGKFVENICQKNGQICKHVLVAKDKRRFITHVKCYNDDHTLADEKIARYNDDPDTPMLIQRDADSEDGSDSQTESPSEFIGTADQLQTGPAPVIPNLVQSTGSIQSAGAIQNSFNAQGSGPTVSIETTAATDINCDRTGTCYDVNVNCRDTKIEVLVQTNKPFNGRVYALGRSETCNVDILNSDTFRLDLSMNGGDCNTQSMNGMFTNTIVLQHHSVVMTKADKIYKVKCTYDMSPRNVTFGMMPIRDPDMISITSAPTAPPPRIRILDPATGTDVETVRIGDRLIFRIEIPGDTPYGIFARGCTAMAKDSRSTFQIIDDDGCPVDPTIFPRFVPDGTALQSNYEAFRFTESYGVIFQCNVRYCLGPCEPAVCPWGRGNVESWGRKKRNVGPKNKTSDDDMTLSQEILVLDFGDDDNKLRQTTAQMPARTVAVAPENYRNNSTYSIHEETVTVFSNINGANCPTKTSVLALSVTCALLLLIYVCTVFYFLMRRWLSPGKHV